MARGPRARYCTDCTDHTWGTSAAPIPSLCAKCGETFDKHRGNQSTNVILRDWANINARYGEEYRGWHMGVDERVTCKQDIREAAARKGLKVMWDGV